MNKLVMLLLLALTSIHSGEQLNIIIIMQWGGFPGSL